MAKWQKYYGYYKEYYSRSLGLIWVPSFGGTRLKKRLLRFVLLIYRVKLSFTVVNLPRKRFFTNGKFTEAP